MLRLLATLVVTVALLGGAALWFAGSPAAEDAAAKLARQAGERVSEAAVGLADELRASPTEPVSEPPRVAASALPPPSVDPPPEPVGPPAPEPVVEESLESPAEFAEGPDPDGAPAVGTSESVAEAEIAAAAPGTGADPAELVRRMLAIYERIGPGR